MPLSTQECKWVQTGLDFGTVGPHGSSADLCTQFSFNAVHRYPSLVTCQFLALWNHMALVLTYVNNFLLMQCIDIHHL